MKRVAIAVVGVYLTLAVSTRVAERFGAIRCGCSSECWCQKPPLSAFRWVTPVGHRGGADHQ